jgi:hypothetical protein
VTNNLEPYSKISPAAHENGKEVERVWYSFMGCWSCGTGQSVSGGLLLPFLKDDERGIFGIELLRLWWRWRWRWRWWRLGRMGEGKSVVEGKKKLNWSGFGDG